MNRTAAPCRYCKKIGHDTLECPALEARGDRYPMTTSERIGAIVLVICSGLLSIWLLSVAIGYLRSTSALDDESVGHEQLRQALQADREDQEQRRVDRILRENTKGL